MALEAILRFTERGNSLSIHPCVPADWREYSIEYRSGAAFYAITGHEPDEMRRAGMVVRLDGRVLDGRTIPLLADGAWHDVHVRPPTQTGVPHP